VFPESQNAAVIDLEMGMEKTHDQRWL
jgi:hypothetical protein